MQAESSLRAILRTTTHLKSFCSTAIVAGIRSQGQYPNPDRNNDQSSRPNFSPRRADARIEGRRASRLRDTAGRRPGVSLEDHETYKDDFESRLERGISRIGFGGRPEGARPRRDGYSKDGRQRPTHEARGSGASGPKCPGRSTPDNARQVSRKPSFGLKQPLSNDQAPGKERGNRSTVELLHHLRSRESATAANLPPHPSPETQVQPHSLPRPPNIPPRDDAQMPWRPAKKLTYQAMAGLRALHANDPKTFDKDALSQRFGISYEAVNRILRSKYQDQKAGDVGESIQGTKWDMDARSSIASPVPAVQRAFARAQQSKQRTRSDQMSAGDGHAR